MKRRILLLAGAAAVLAGCAGMYAHHEQHHRHVRAMSGPPIQCPPQNCPVTIKVTSCSAAGIDAPDIVVQKGDRNMNIVFRLEAPENFRFRDKGIVVKQDVHGEFSGTPGPRVFTLHNKHNVEGRKYEYGVHLTDGSRDCDKDPYIAN